MGRHYEIDGKLYPSVTTILSIIRKPYLERWRGEIGNEDADCIMEEAGELGSEIHDIAENIARGKLWDATSEDVVKMGEALESWFADNVLDVIATEQFVFHPLYQYAGRLDLIALVRGDEHPSIIDIKTGGVWPEAYLQLAAYQTAYEGQHLKWIERRIVLHVDKKNPGSIIAKDAPHDSVTDWNMFLYALELYRYFNKSEPGKGQIVKITGGKEHD